MPSTRVHLEPPHFEDSHRLFTETLLMFWDYREAELVADGLAVVVVPVVVRLSTALGW